MIYTEILMDSHVIHLMYNQAGNAIYIPQRVDDHIAALSRHKVVRNVELEIKTRGPIARRAQCAPFSPLVIHHHKLCFKTLNFCFIYRKNS